VRFQPGAADTGFGKIGTDLFRFTSTISRSLISRLFQLSRTVPLLNGKTPHHRTSYLILNSHGVATTDDIDIKQ
jgi:hypothetical protein